MKTLAVLLPTYNAAHFLNEAIDSVLAQTYSDFQLYILDDCSTDNTRTVVKSYSDSRINYIKNNKNLGLAGTLNKGIKMLASEFTYLARMDADDFYFPKRFKRQVEFLEQNREFVLCGTQGFWLKNFEEQAQSPWKYPSTHREIKYHLLFSACFGHSSIMFRSEFLVKNEITYNENIKTCEDWELWTRIVRLGKVANLSDYLLKYRITENSNHRSQNNREVHLKERSQVISNHWNSFDITCDESFIFDTYFNVDRKSKSVLKSNLSKLIDMSNQLIEKAVEELETKELSKLKYRLLRNIKRTWVQSKISGLSIDIWLLVIQRVRFSNTIYTFKTMLR